jgi:hypothetical protein
VHTIASAAILQLNTGAWLLLPLVCSEQLLLAARHEFTTLSNKDAAVVYLPAVITQHYLDQLLKADFNPFDDAFLQPSGLMPLRLAYHKFRRTF